MVRSKLDQQWEDPLSKAQAIKESKKEREAKSVIRRICVRAWVLTILTTNSHSLVVKIAATITTQLAMTNKLQAIEELWHRDLE